PPHPRALHPFPTRRSSDLESAPDAGGAFAAAAADPDVALMLRCQSGEEAAFQDLFRKFSPRVLQFARRFVGSEARAEEVTQDVLDRKSTRLNSSHLGISYA